MDDDEHQDQDEQLQEEETSLNTMSVQEMYSPKNRAQVSFQAAADCDFMSRSLKEEY